MNQASTPPARRRDIERLLQLGAEAARGGNRQAARSLFLALAREHPDDPRVWAGLAGVAASRNEQREALQHIVALEPANERARRALERLVAPPARPAAARVTPALPETAAEPRPATVEIMPRHEPAAARPVDVESAETEERARRAPFPLLNALAMGLILLLLLAVGVVLGRAFMGGAESAALPTATASLILQPPPAGSPVSAAPTSAPTAQLPTAVAATIPPAPSPAPAEPTAPPPAATAGPASDPSTLPLGTIIDHDGWSISLLRPDYALALDGAIGDLQPSGRFVLAVVAVSNNAPEPRVLPSDLFVLTDNAGRSYLPVPGASSAYLALYQRAQYGDLALEDGFDPSSGMRSVPILFDAPPDAAGLRLTVSGAGPAGWPVGEPGPTLLPSGP